METYIFKLTRQARSSGSDRYETRMALEPKPVAIYVPQSISRCNNAFPEEEIEITFNVISKD